MSTEPTSSAAPATSSISTIVTDVEESIVGVFTYTTKNTVSNINTEIGHLKTHIADYNKKIAANLESIKNLTDVNAGLQNETDKSQAFVDKLTPLIPLGS